MNIQDIKNNYRIEDVIGRHVALKPKGHELVGQCIFHDDTHHSLQVNPQKQIFKCFPCGAGGDMFDFFTEQGLDIKTDYKEIVNSITNGQIITGFQPVQNSAPKPPEWTNAVPDKPADLNNLKFKDYPKPTRCDAYHDENGIIRSYAIRFDLPNSGKDVLPYSFKTDGRVSRWGWRRLDLPHPLYDLHLLKQNPDKFVLVVEGEKTAEAAKLLFPKYAVTTWLGGKENVGKTDWSPLAGRNVYLWADNDAAGVLAMYGGWDNREGKSKEYKRFKGVVDYVGANFKRIQNSPEFPKKWDVADAFWNEAEAMEYLKANRCDVPIVSEIAPMSAPEPATETVAEPVVTPTPEHAIEPARSVQPERREAPQVIEPKNQYFRCLGFENNEQNSYVFFVRTNVIIKLTAAGISTANLLQLAPLRYWEDNFPNFKKTGPKFDINTIADTLISACTRMGLFNPKKLRGRGAWIENDTPVIHCGDRLIINGIETQLSEHKSKFIYQTAFDLGINMVKPLSKNDANKLLKWTDRLNWSRSVEGRLLVGWIVIAPLCGALKWRPHMWLTGVAGAGKSEVLKMLPKTMLGEMALNVQGKTSESGIRQSLVADALPVIFDEAEGENKAAHERIQNVAELMRGSSTSDGGKIILGSSAGKPMDFSIRSCFFFASINHTLTQRSDLSRTTIIELKEDKSDDKEQKWTQLKKDYYEFVDDKYVDAFICRSIKMMPVILENAKVFSRAAASELKDQRAGDQLGALLAGAYSLVSDAVISFENAKKWIHEKDWSQEKLNEETKDEVVVLNKILNAEIQVETEGYGRLTRAVGELIINARGDVMKDSDSKMISEELAAATLKRAGVLVNGFDVIFSNSSAFINKIFAGSPSAKNYHTILSRVEGAEKTEATFAGFIKSKATKIPSEKIFGKLENPGISKTETEIYSQGVLL